MPKISPSIVNSCKGCTARCCKWLAVVLTIPEALRLLSATGAQPNEVLEFSCNIDSRATPHYPLFVKGQKGAEEWYIIIRRQGRDCIFLGNDSACGIYNDRPYVCRLYPYELDGKTIKKGALCPMKFAREANMERDAAKIKQDLLSHEIIARKWGVERGAKGVRPEIGSFLQYFGR
jgi:Fe-S-cluster containining protein